MKYLLGIAALVAGYAFGDWFPDIDQKTGLLLHRSILTHGFLLLILIFAIAFPFQLVSLRWFALGSNLGIAVHLIFDLFPKGWSGFALISVPTHGWTAPWFSWIWIAVSIVVCTLFAARLVRNGLEGTLFTLSLIFAFVYIANGEDAIWRPVVALMVTTVLGLILITRGSARQADF